MCDVLVTGAFNVIQAGDVELLKFATKFGRVTVGIKADSLLHTEYGKEYTVPAINRAKVLRSIKHVEDVVMYTEEDASALIIQLQPTYYVTTPGTKILEEEALYAVDAEIVLHQLNQKVDSVKLSKALPTTAFISAVGKLPKRWQDY